MRALRLLATLLLVALSTGLYSCGDDIERSPITSITPDNEGGSKEDPFKDYLGEDYSNITCQSLDFRLGDTVTISGLKSKHLWFAYFDKSSKKKMFEWVDVEETDTIQQLHKGYGEYEQIIIKGVGSVYYKKTSTGDIVQFGYFSKTIGGYQTIFTSNSKTKRTTIQAGNYGDYMPYDWYKESILIRNYCYTHEGDVVYTADENYKYFLGGTYKKVELISYEEAILLDWLNDLSFKRYNYKEGKALWNIYLSDIKVPREAILNCTILDKSTNIWEYKIDITSYDGIKQEHIFKINIDTGKLIDTSSIVGKWKLAVDDGSTHTHVTFTKDGTFSYTSTNELDYEEHGTYKIVDDLLYQMFSDEDEWAIGEILLLNSETLSIQDLDDDGVTPRGKPYSYQRVE